MPKVEIHSYTVESDYDTREATVVYVDGVSLGTGFYGGENEDNTRSRDYCWVEGYLADLAEKLGAEVVVKCIDQDPEFDLWSDIPEQLH